MKTVAILTLLSALHAVESDSGTDPKCGGNEYQITRRCVDDVNRICTRHKFYHRFKYADVKDPVKSRGIALIYLCHYGNVYRRETGNEPTAEVYARIWNGGPDGWKKKSTEAYWKKISKKLEVAK